MRGQRGFPGTFFTATGLVHQLMEARDERRLIKDPKDAVEYRPVIYTRHAARLIRPQRPNGGPGDLLPLRDEHPEYKSVRRAPIPFSCHGGAARTTGPYALVRHPMYTGALVMLLGIPISLGSWWGLLVIAAMIPALIWRLIDEEKFLARNLPGYVEYQKKVRYRLIPLIC
jgi:hypothetical protein